MIISPYTVEEIAVAAEGVVEGICKHKLNNISIDSRDASIDEHTIYFALKGDNNDGHNYLKEVYKKGCRAFVVAENHTEQIGKDALFIKVKNTTEALQKLAGYHRKKFDIPVVAITGSFGKTTVKEWLYELLSTEKIVIRSPKSYNSQIGVPLSLLMLNSNHELALIEAGISQPGEMQKLEKMIEPTHGVLTGIGQSHAENFLSAKHILQEKSQLFVDAKQVFCHQQFSEGIKNTTLVGQGNGAKLKIINKIQIHQHTELTLLWNNEHELSVNIPFTDEPSINNVLLCILIALELNISEENIRQAVANLRPLALRMEVLEANNNNILVNDAYNSDLNGLEYALEFISKQKADKNIVLISSPYHEKQLEFVASLIKKFNLNEWVIIGDLAKGLPQFATHHFTSIDAFLSSDYFKQLSNKAILIKGTRNAQFERISRQLQKVIHATSLEINLNAIHHNVSVFKQLLKPDTKLMFMIKAFGYGTGSIELAKHLQQFVPTYFGVAYANEGEELRKAGIHTPIMVMNPEPGSFESIVEQNLEPEIYSFSLLDGFIRTLIDAGKTNYPIHIKIDSGMHRQGFLPEEIDRLIATIQSQPEVRLASVFSHLAAADEPQHNHFTQQQIQVFEQCRIKFVNTFGDKIITHLLNSHGVIHFPEHQYNMVRLGIGIYGEDVTEKIKQKLLPVARFKTTITQIKHIKKGESLGYGRSTILSEDKIIAILPVGYADGYFRALSNKANVFVNRNFASVIGNISMDVTMIDITHINAKEGDEVELFGSNISIAELAKLANTIPYEILTSISRRVKRVYLNE
jgi:Alr-MurF fusion protein